MRILLTVLNWGLGHATRCIPLIDLLLQEEKEVFIASNGAALALLKQRYPSLTFFELPDYGIRYPSKNALLNLISFTPQLLRAIYQEHRLTQELIKRHQIEYLISDNRLGCYSKKIKCAYISHQLRFAFKNPILKWGAGWLHFFWYRKFDELWIPDLPPPNGLSGYLSKSLFRTSIQYLGLLSALKKLEAPLRYEVIVILSGPEPQRTKLEQVLLSELEQLQVSFFLVRGLPEVANEALKWTYGEGVNFLDAKALAYAIAKARFVICRSGYSSIMDLVRLQKRAILIPTPGQPEQVYLAQFHEEKGYFVSTQQGNLVLKEAIRKLDQLKPLPQVEENQFLGEVLRSFLETAKAAKSF